MTVIVHVSHRLGVQRSSVFVATSIGEEHGVEVVQILRCESLDGDGADIGEDVEPDVPLV